MADYFLLTTGNAPRDFRAPRVLVAGDWCGKITASSDANASLATLDYPIDCLDAVKIKSEIDLVFNELLSRTAIAYNDVFGLSNDNRYYKIILGRWIFHFLHNIYEKREILTSALAQYPELTMESCGKAHILAFDSNDYNEQSYASHDFNYRMFSGVAEFLSGIRKSYVDIAPPAIRASYSKTDIPATLKHGLQLLACELNKLLRNRMTLVVSPFYPHSGLYNSLWFFIKSGGKIVHYKFPAPLPSGVGLDVELRALLSQKVRSESNNQLLNIASELFFYFSPQSFVEYFTSYREETLRWLKKYPKVTRVFTANAIHTDELFKYLVAEAPFLDLWICQHGAGYGFLEILSSENYERELANRFFTWGWGADVLPHPKLVSNRRIRYEGNEAIIFTFPTVSRYAGLLESYFIASNYQRTLYLSDQLLQHLTSEMLANILVRQREIKGFRMYKPPVDVREDCTLSFQDSLKRARLHLSNHIGTPALESLAMNLPTIILYDPSVHRMRSSAAPFFKQLEDVQVLFEDAAKAAHHLNSVYANVDEWWMCDATQAAVNAFCSRFAQSDRNWKVAWLNVLK